MVRNMESKAALIACALFCDWSLEQVDGGPRDFCLVSKGDGATLVEYTSNLAGCDRLTAVEMLLGAAKRILDAHERDGG